MYIENFHSNLQLLSDMMAKTLIIALLLLVAISGSLARRGGGRRGGSRRGNYGTNSTATSASVSNDLYSKQDGFTLLYITILYYCGSVYQVKSVFTLKCNTPKH